IHYYNFAASERYHLRLLFTVICNLKIFEDLRIVNEVLCNLFRDICKLLQLVKYDQEWINSFTEVFQFVSSNSLRSISVSALLLNELNSLIGV
ncbi:MAG: hypothetical protein EXX96DRAFT_490744, partial [Benjaminiella poitrasii]